MGHKIQYYSGHMKTMARKRRITFIKANTYIVLSTTAASLKLYWLLPVKL